MSEPILTRFADQPQNIASLGVSFRAQRPGEKHTRCRVLRDDFALDVEIMVCRKIAGGLTPDDLRRRNQTQRYAVPRHFCAFILYNHPYSKDYMSAPEIGRRYARDHTTIISSLRRAEALLVRSHARRDLLQEGLDRLAHRYGAFELPMGRRVAR